jgi:methylenetetrahydrofolate reductase (NADPH)
VNSAQSRLAPHVDPATLKRRIIDFMRAASMEITPSEEPGLAQLVELLPRGTAVYIAHTPNTTLAQVVKTAIAVQRAGFRATPHVVARRLNYPHTLRIALAELCAGGVEQILLIAGDVGRAAGEFENTLDVLNSGSVEGTGIKRLGIAGHPEGHRDVSSPLLWSALKEKQAFAQRTGIKVYVVTQFGFDADAVPHWCDELALQNIDLPVHIGIAGPVSLSKLIRFAMACGIGASLRSVARNLSTAAAMAGLSTRPEQHVAQLMKIGASATRVTAPHFFSFGASLETARWIRRVSSGGFTIDPQDCRIQLED